MIEFNQTCLKITRDFHAVEKAMNAAKKVIGVRLDESRKQTGDGKASEVKNSVSEFKVITKYL